MKSVSDRYIIVGTNYIKLQKAINDCFTERNDVPLGSILTTSNSKLLYPYILLAVYKNITTLYKDVQNVPIDIFTPVLSRHYAHNTYEWKMFMENNLTHNLKISKDNWSHIELNLLLIQLKSFITASRSKLVAPLSNLIQNPLEFADSYLPCMPQDSLYDIHNAVRASARNENPTFYMCPNNHPYVLFNCGRPWVKLKCEVCNADIGGENHNLTANNRKLDVQDSTMKGHCLNFASVLPDTPANERELNGQSFHLLRFMIHACLYFACDGGHELTRMMTARPDNMKKFFWEHMQKDLRIASRLLNVNVDELLILLHYITDKMRDGMSDPSNQVYRWISKEERKSWESHLSRIFFDPILNNSSNFINEATRKLQENESNKKEDDQSKTLYFMAYELTNDDSTKTKTIYEKSEFWKFLPNVNLGLLELELNTTHTDDYIFLKRFIQMVYFF